MFVIFKKKDTLNIHIDVNQMFCEQILLIISFNKRVE